ncbi:MAG: porin PorA family protein [Smithellaceae bacterium]|nr:porin PorA family protein [Smithellaceae bacterium]
MKKIFLAAGLVLLGFAAFWHFLLAPQWTQRIPPGWTWQTNFIGAQALPDERTGKLPEKDITILYSRETRIVDEGERPSSVVIDDTYITKDALTNQKTYEYAIRYPLDPRTGEHLTPEYRGDYALFPRNTARKDYRYRASYIVNGIPLTWQKEAELDGVKTYLFHYKGPIEYTITYLGTPEYPGVIVPVGQVIRCSDEQFTFKVWVEPLTGEIARLEESCYSGDYIYDKSTGKKLAAVMRWGGESAGDDDILRLDRIRRDRKKILWLSRYIPLALFLAGLALLVPGLAPKRGRS